MTHFYEIQCYKNHKNLYKTSPMSSQCHAIQKLKWKMKTTSKWKLKSSKNSLSKVKKKIKWDKLFRDLAKS